MVKNRPSRAADITTAEMWGLAPLLNMRAVWRFNKNLSSATSTKLTLPTQPHSLAPTS